MRMVIVRMAVIVLERGGKSPVLLDRVRNIAYNTRMVASSKEERQTMKWGFMETAGLLCRRIGHSIVCTRYWGSWDEEK